MGQAEKGTIRKYRAFLIGRESTELFHKRENAEG